MLRGQGLHMVEDSVYVRVRLGCKAEKIRGLQLLGQPTHMGGCQNYGPFLGTLNIRCRTIIRTQERTIILTTTYILGAAINRIGFL